MSKPLRIQYPDAWYHVMNRGRHGDVTPYTTNYLTRRMKGDTLKEAGEVWKSARIARLAVVLME